MYKSVDQAEDKQTYLRPIPIILSVGPISELQLEDRDIHIATDIRRGFSMTIGERPYSLPDFGAQILLRIQATFLI